MKPAEKTRVWRKNGREADRGVPQGRRTSHRVKTANPRASTDRSRQTEVTFQDAGQ